MNAEAGRQPWLVAIVVAVGCTAIAAVLRHVLGAAVQEDIPYLTFTGGIVLAAWLAGTRGGLLTALFSHLATQYLFVDPIHLFRFNGPGNVTGSILFAVIGVAISVMVGNLHSARRELSDRNARLEVETSERQSAKQLAEFKRDQLRATIESIGDAIIVTDRSGRISKINSVALELTGTDRSMFSGSMTGEIVRLFNADGVVLENVVDRTLAAGERIDAPDGTMLRSASGESHEVELSVFPVKSDDRRLLGTVMVFRDVTQRRAAEAELQRSRTLALRRLAELQAIYGTTPVGLCVLDREMRYVQINEHLAEINGRSVEDHLGVPLGQIVPSMEQQYRAVFDRVVLSGIGERNIEMYESSGEDSSSAKTFLASWHPWREESGEIAGVLVVLLDVTERKAFQLSLGKWRSVFDQSGWAAATVDSESNAIDLANPAFAKMHGYEESMLKGRDLCDLIAPEDLDAYSEHAVRSRDEQYYVYDLRHLRRDGSTFWCRTRVSAVPTSGGRTYRSATFEDITDARRVEEEFRRTQLESTAAHAKFRAFFDQGSIIGGLIGTDGTVLEANRSSWEGCGFTSEQMLGRPLWDGPWWGDRRDIRQIIKLAVASAASGEMFRREIPYETAEGNGRFVDLTLLPVEDDEGRVTFLAMTGTDVTERQQLEERLRAVAEDLAQSNRRKDEFLATLSHELRNPLAPIRSGLQIMRNAPDEEAVVRAGAIVDRQLAQLVRLVDDLLDASRIGRGKLSIKREWIDLSAVVDNAIELSRPLIDASGQTLHVEIPSEPVRLFADHVRLVQVLANVMNNAAKYSLRGGRIWLTARCREGHLEIRVRDEGDGIEPDMLEEVFGLFAQVERSDNRGQTGLGIGLALAKNLVEMHEGTIRASSEGRGSGAEFLISLPLTGRQEDQSSAVEPAVVEQHEALVRVLIADDNVDAAETLGMMLQLMGHEVRIARNGSEAVNIAGDFRPQLALLDIGMPVMDGLDACRELRRREQSEKTKMRIVALSGWSQDADRQRSQEAGFDLHLVKPIAPTMLQEVLRNVT